MKRLDDAIAAVMDRGIVPATDQQLESDLVNLSFMGIWTRIGALDDALRANDEQIRQFARAWIAHLGGPTVAPYIKASAPFT